MKEGQDHQSLLLQLGKEKYPIAAKITTQKNSLHKSVLEAMKKARKRPQTYYKNSCFRTLFCNSFGQDGTDLARRSALPQNQSPFWLEHTGSAQVGVLRSHIFLATFSQPGEVVSLSRRAMGCSWSQDLDREIARRQVLDGYEYVDDIDDRGRRSCVDPDRPPRRQHRMPRYSVHDRAFAMHMVSKEGTLLARVSEELKGDREIVMKAVSKDEHALAWASAELRGDREIVMKAVSKNGFALQHASEELRGDREIVMKAVGMSGYALKYASEQLRGDRKIVMKAVSKDGQALQHASEELRGDPRDRDGSRIQPWVCTYVCLGRAERRPRES